MKKFLIVFGTFASMFFLFGKIYAAVPIAQLNLSRTAYSIPAASTNSPTPQTYPIAGSWNTVLAGSSAPASGSAATLVFPIFQSTFTTNGGVSNSTYTARNCITDITATLSNASTFYLLDGGTTDYVVYGAAILAFSGATSSEWIKHWDGTAPFCGTAGNTLTLSIPAPAVGTSVNAVSADGFTVFTGLQANFNLNQ